MMSAADLVLGAACVWVLLAALMAMLFRGRRLWMCAYGLIATGIPLLVALFLTNGPWIGLGFLAAGLSILRWPVIYLWRWLTRNRRTPDADA
ncbi:DUF2484 family protein [Donghicola mangrovi]|nr:DUF2484 family protein [Donghicola mangrovi]